MLVGWVSIDTANSEILTSASMNSKAGTFSKWYGGQSSKMYGDNGGGTYCIAVVSCITDSVVSLVGYGYHNSGYKHIGSIFAVQLK